MLARLVRAYPPVVVLTGAGVSTESGIPDFRSPGSGLWTKMDPMEDLSARVLRHRPGHFWRCFAQLRGPSVTGALPNRAHLALARLEERGHISGVITQNIDGLHQKAGSRKVTEIHGHLRTARCLRCGLEHPLDDALAQVASRGVPECRCGGGLRPNVVLFGDPMPPEFGEAREIAASSRLMLVVGSSLTVWPAASLTEIPPYLAVVNREPTHADGQAEIVIRGSAGDAFEALAGCLDQ